jgi:hypothetical protein
MTLETKCTQIAIFWQFAFLLNSIHELLTFFSLDGFHVQNLYINPDADFEFDVSKQKCDSFFESTVSLQRIGKVVQTFVQYIEYQ